MLDFRIMTFLELCNLKSYTKTAQALCITQPAVTQHVQYLEQYYGVRLVEYEGRRLTVTPAGLLLKNAAQRMLADEKKLIGLMRQTPSQRPQLRLGATLSIGEYLLPPVIGDYLACCPETELQLQIGNTASLLGRLRAGELDCALVEGYFDRTSFYARLLMRDDFIAVCGRNYPFAAPPVRLDDLLFEPLLVREEGSGTREVLMRILHEHGRALAGFQKQICIGSLHVIQRLCGENAGITFLYRSAARAQLESGALRELTLEDFHAAHEYQFVTLPDSIFADAHTAFFEFVKKRL